MGTFEQQTDKFRTQPGFIAALDQSGGSTPKALGLSTRSRMAMSPLATVPSGSPWPM